MVQFNEEKQEQRLEEFRAKEQEDLAQMLSKKHSVPYVDLAGIPIDTDALKLIDEKKAREHNIAAFDLVGKTVRIAVRAPEHPAVQEIVEELKKAGWTPMLYIASMTSIEKAWDRYKDVSYAVESKEGLLEINDKEITSVAEGVSTVEEVRALIDDILLNKKNKTSRIVEIILAGALALSASDVHIEPEEGQIKIRMRIDGILLPVIDLNEEIYHLILSRIKLLSGLKLNIHGEPQDGRFSITVGSLGIEIRTSVIPGSYGESIVMRILNPDAIQVGMEELGMLPTIFKVIEHEISKPNGMIINTGPTGSGKTTTLYAFLRKVHQPGIKIITIEDPVEYHLDGIVQTQVDTEKDYTFASGLRASLRQDPDILMVGEIRDEETAETAVHSALTGHLVFTTLHTNDAAGSFPRLVDMGIQKNVFGASINAVMAQRLVRKLCDVCKKEIPLEGENRGKILPIVATIPQPEAYADVLPPKGTTVWKQGEDKACTACGGLGYKGRIGIFEIILMTPQIEELIRGDASKFEITKLALKTQKLPTLVQDGVIKVMKGITSIEELDRVVEIVPPVTGG